MLTIKRLLHSEGRNKKTILKVIMTEIQKLRVDYSKLCDDVINLYVSGTEKPH